ncbi:PREDICTED: uncharacterized protein LOC108975946 [Bactrocera latifrons]|uniref:uncharacterized protein LOC108975946 n=1 Tax=Bactrocera latifrons TaxID=174628 RepID=UPI0008DCB37A|nr:PREDICTED: uncharacterized protein LOC108975946 [Bactrocera latifrons]
MSFPANMESENSQPSTSTMRSVISVPRPGVAITSGALLLTMPIGRRPHRQQYCGLFKGLSPIQRQKIAQAHGHCQNCLAPTHATHECYSGALCHICGRQYHTLLYRTSRRAFGWPRAPRSRGTTRPQQISRVARRRRPAPPRESRLWRQRNATSTRRHQRPQQQHLGSAT